MPEGHDIRVMVAGIKKAREIVSQDAMSEWAGEELFPGQDVQTDEQIADYVKAHPQHRLPPGGHDSYGCRG
jgi:choline oxidase